MLVTSVMVGRVSLLELVDSTTYAVATETLYALTSSVPSTPRMVEMAGRAPFYGGRTPTARTIPLLVFMLRPNAPDRRDDFEALKTALDDSIGLVELRWTEGGSAYRYWCHVGSVAASLWYTRASADASAPNPIAEVVS
jgi:hypothetical protein